MQIMQRHFHLRILQVSGVAGAALGSALIYALPVIIYVSSRADGASQAGGRAQNGPKKKWGVEEALAVAVGAAGSAAGLVFTREVLRG
jgi:hypothetical protein